jgi:methylenetetrahydrofolate dehydrogenase (NADP+)/methenyltetrahydrofolate cyclohydrolase
MAKILEAKTSCQNLEKEIKAEVSSLGKLCLASVSIDGDYSSFIYCSSQKKLGEKLGINYHSINLKPQVSFEEFARVVKELNNDSNITGIILNKPFPSKWKDEDVFFLLDSRKDIEGMHPVNLGKFFMGESLMSSQEAKYFVSPTVLSVLELIKQAEIKLYGKKVTIVGFSNIIGKPLAILLGDELATVSITHIATSKVGDLESYVKAADILISATGVPGLIKGDWIKPGAVVIDVGTGEKQGKISGDVEFEKAKAKAAVITPVPGGVGKLTTMFLYHNLIIAAKKQKNN